MNRISRHPPHSLPCSLESHQHSEKPEHSSEHIRGSKWEINFYLKKKNSNPDSRSRWSLRVCISTKLPPKWCWHSVTEHTLSSHVLNQGLGSCCLMAKSGQLPTFVSVSGIQPCPTIYTLFTVSFALQRQSRIVVTENLRPIKPKKYLLSGPLQENPCPRRYWYWN